MQDVADDQKILEALKSGRNILLTGEAGSGKSYLASDFCKSMPQAIMTATTGVAALIAGGDTLHRVLGLGVTARPEEAGRILGKWANIMASIKPWDRSRVNMLQNLRTLIIDESSMLRRDQFELVDVVLSFVKNFPMPFGGTQIVLVGDYFQLPPVVTQSDLKRYPDLKRPYCFQSDLWEQANFQSFNLTTNYRQDDEEFLKILGKIRVGKVTKDVAEVLDSRVGANLNIPMQPVKLFSKNIDVFQENIRCLKALPDEKIVSDAEFVGKEYDCKILAKECPADKELYFCKNAQVMMLTNDPKGKWVNGTMGIIQSVHPIKIKLSSGQTVAVEPHTWERQAPKANASTGEIDSTIVAKMTQYPFKLAYSTSIHRSQGLTLDYIDVDLSNCFAPGQAYVALSRVKTLAGLKIKSWNKKSIKADPRVLKFYRNIQK